MCPLSIVPAPPHHPPLSGSAPTTVFVCSEGLSSLSAGVLHTCSVFGVALFLNKSVFFFKFILLFEVFLETRTVHCQIKEREV